MAMMEAEGPQGAHRAPEANGGLMKGAGGASARAGSAAAEPELDMNRSAVARVGGAMRRMLAALHLPGRGAPGFATPRRAIDRELQEYWPSYD
jgi:hypothetical protein